MGGDAAREYWMRGIWGKRSTDPERFLAIVKGPMGDIRRIPSMGGEPGSSLLGERVDLVRGPAAVVSEKRHPEDYWN